VGWGLSGEKQIKCVVTGFDAFGEHDSNPSELAVRRLPGILNVDTHCKVVIVKGTLPTCCQGGWEALKELVEKAGDARIILMTGVAGTRNAICLERFALNIRDYRIADNQGHQWKDEAIVRGGAEALRSDLPLRSFADQLNAAGFVVDVSNHAGSFICNEVYYRALAQFAQEGRQVVFVHFPKTGWYGKAQEEAERADLDHEKVLQTYAEALELLVKEICKAVVAV
jgi:pyroglutamyl-peptidase